MRIMGVNDGMHSLEAQVQPVTSPAISAAARATSPELQSAEIKGEYRKNLDRIRTHGGYSH
jgi:hypothetical protein